MVPWQNIGDFNCVLDDEERSSNKGASSCFQEWTNRKGMINLGYVGAVYTWSHGVSVPNPRVAHLDRAMCDDVWRRLYRSARVKHLPHCHSDHCPLLLELEEVGAIRLGARPFRFEATWMTSPAFEDLLKKEWMRDNTLSFALRELSKLQGWNMTTIGNIFKRKKRSELRIGGEQRALARRMTGYLLSLERELKEERSLILRQVELLWLQKSRNEWWKSGDGNTKFFHTSTLIRRRRNKVEVLLNNEGRWIEDKE